MKRRTLQCVIRRSAFWHENHSRGFTLLEILLAIVILGTVLSTVFASYTGTFRVINDIDGQLEIYQMARTAMDRIVEDLESVYVPPSVFNKEEDSETKIWHEFLGEENGSQGEATDSLLFSSQTHIHFGPKNESGTNGIAVIRYYVEEQEGTDTLVLYRSDRLLLETGPISEIEGDTTGFPLCEGLASVDFKFYNTDGEESETWSLKEETSLPTMVSVTLEFVSPSDPEGRYVFSTKIGIPVSLVEEGDDG